MSVITKDLGAVTAYAAAVNRGYTGSREEFETLMASYAYVGEQAAESASNASQSATDASQSATDAETAKGTAQQAATDAQTAQASAQGYAQSAQQSAQSASQSAQNAESAKQTAVSTVDGFESHAQQALDSVNQAGNNWKSLAQAKALDSEAWAVGKRGGEDVGSSDPAYNNNAKWYALTAATDATTASDAAQTATAKASEAQISASAAAESARTLTIDATLTKAGQAADSKVVGDKISDLNPLKSLIVNLFNPNTANVLGLVYYASGRYFSTSNTSKMIAIPCKPNTEYTVMQTLTSGRFSVFTSSEYPANGVACTLRSGSTYTSPKKITTGANDNYIAVRIYDSGIDTTHTLQEHLDSVMVAEGEVTSFYGYGEIQVESNMLSEGTYDTIDSRATALIDSAIKNIGTDIYGIRINTDGTVDRLASAVGKSNDYVVGNSFVGEGTNDFDGIYPWSEIKTCDIGVNTDGDTVITYEGQAGFARDGSNGSVYVEIPKFFTKRYLDDDGNEVILISGTRHGGFVVEPAFFDSETGEEIEHIYVGAYLTQTSVNAMNSISGVFPASNVSLDEFKAKSGEMYDFVTLQAIQKLMSVEFGRVKFSEVFGGFSYLPWSSSVKADGNATNTNTGNFKGDSRLANIGVGNTITIATSSGQIQNRTVTAVGEVTQVGGGYYRSVSFDGDPVDLVDNSTMLYCTGQKTGFTDSLTYHTGRTNLNSGSTYSNQFRYRGIEGLWGTLGEIMDGIIVKALKAYWSNLKSDYGDVTKCKRLNFAVPLQNTYTNSPDALPPQIKKMGWDFKYPTIAFPEVLAAKSEQYYGDLFFSVKNVGPDGQSYSDGDEFIGVSSMAWDGHEDNGLYTIRFWAKANAKSWLYGSRAIIRHLV